MPDIRTIINAPGGTVAIAGGRHLHHTAKPLVTAITQSLLDQGFNLAVGCCKGVDETVIANIIYAEAAPVAKRLTIYSAFGDCEPTPSITAVDILTEAGKAGAKLVWNCSRTLTIPVAARLARRTDFMLRQPTAALVTIWTRPESKGTALACRTAINRHIPTLAFTTWGWGEPPPHDYPGSWERIPTLSEPWHTGWIWAPSENLFGGS
jgi:hypothetical protein